MTAGHRARARAPGAKLAAAATAVVLSAFLLGGCMPSADQPATVQPARDQTAASRDTTDPSTDRPAADQVVVQSEVGQTRAAEYQDLAVRAIALVEDLWGPGAVARPVQLVLPADDVRFAELTGHADDESEIPASTVGSGANARIVVHPDAWDRLSAEGRQAVLTHEVTHLAMQGHGPVPGWFGEGLAEFTAHRGSSLSPPEIAGSALDPVREGTLPAGWPGEDPRGVVDSAGGGQWQRYAMAWLACRYIAEEHSEEDLLALYQAVEGGLPWQEAVPAMLSVTDRELLSGWRRWLVELVS